MSPDTKDIPIVKKNWIKKPTWRNITLLIIVFLLYYLAKPTLLTFLIGGLLVISGELIRLWAAGYLMKNLELVVAGPYAFIRDPLYLGSFLIFSGLSVVGRNWILLVVVLLGFFGFYLPHKIKVETTRLKELFGEPYEDYLSKVRSIIPRLIPYPNSGDVWEFRQIFHNSEHATGIVVVLAWLIFALYLR